MGRSGEGASGEKLAEWRRGVVAEGRSDGVAELRECGIVVERRVEEWRFGGVVKRWSKGVAE